MSMIPSKDLECDVVGQSPARAFDGTVAARVRHRPTGIVAICGTGLTKEASLRIAVAMIEAAIAHPDCL